MEKRAETVEENGGIKDVIYFIDGIAPIIDLPQPVIRAFDGDGFVWIWREPKDSAFAEVKLRVRLDSLGEGIEVQISASAWTKKKIQSLIYSARYWSSKVLASESKRVSEGLVPDLKEAWWKAIDMRDKILNVS